MNYGSHCHTIVAVITEARAKAMQAVVATLGADTFGGDPISHFRLETKDYAPLARRIASLGKPSLIVMEGGYAVDALGPNVASFLEGFG